MNLLPFLFNKNARKKVKKTRRTIKNKNIKQQQNKDEIIYDNSNDIFEENFFIDNSTVNETQLIDENDQIPIFDEFDRYEDIYFDENENNDLIFNFEQSQYF